MIDLRTNKQKERDSRKEKVLKLFKKLKEQSNGSDTAIIKHIEDTLTSNGCSVSEMGIRYILKREGMLCTK